MGLAVRLGEAVAFVSMTPSLRGELEVRKRMERGWKRVDVGKGRGKVPCLADLGEIYQLILTVLEYH